MEMNHAISVRECRLEDVSRLFQWRNHPDIIAVSTHQASVTWPEHAAWFRRSIADRDRHRLYIAEINNAPVGTTRFDRQSAGHAIVSAYLNPDQTGQGFGARMITDATRSVAVEWIELQDVLAHVRQSNLRGRRSFEKAGFILTSEELLQGHDTLIWRCPAAATRP